MTARPPSTQRAPSTQPQRTVSGDISMQEIFDQHSQSAGDLRQDQREFKRVGRIRIFGWKRIMARNVRARDVAHDERLGQPWKSVLRSLLKED